MTGEPTYAPDDRERHLGEPPYNLEDPAVLMWERAHSHFVTQKCIPENRCMAYVEALERAEAELIDLRAVFDLQQTRMAEATEAWRAESPDERESVGPDLGDLLAWLLRRAERDVPALVAEVRRLRQRVENLQWQIDYMREEISTTLAVRIDSPSEAVDMVRALKQHADKKNNEVRRLHTLLTHPAAHELLTHHRYLDASGYGSCSCLSVTDYGPAHMTKPEWTAHLIEAAHAEHGIEVQ